MLTSYPPLDSTFSNPVAACPSLSHTSSADSHPQHHCLQLPWLGSLPSWTAPNHCPKENNILQKKAEEIKSPETLTKAMSKPPDRCCQPRYVTDPQHDLVVLTDNERKLELSGYYYGNLSWIDASQMLSKCKVGTFLIRDSEHSQYLYTITVQTRKGPTSCRIEYDRGFFRLDSSQSLKEKMPRFDCVPSLVDHYVVLTKNLPRKDCTKELSPVWLDIDEENTRDVPVQIFIPLYKEVRSLQNMCRVAIVRRIKERYPSMTVSRTLRGETEYKDLPSILRNFINSYPFSQ